MTKEELLEKYYKNDRPQELKERIITEYAPLIKLVCGRLSNYTSGILEMEDLYSYGTFGLIDAIDRFDITKDIKFETYASIRIKGAVADEIRKIDMVPRTAREKQKLIASAKQRLRNNGHYTNKDLADECGMTEEALDKTLADLERWNFVWLDNTETETEDYSDDSGKYTPKSTYKAPESVVDDIGMDSLKEKLNEALNDLTEMERLAVNLVFYENLSQTEAAEVMNISQGRTSQLIGKSLSKLKEKLGEYAYLFAPENI